MNVPVPVPQTVNQICCATLRFPCCKTKETYMRRMLSNQYLIFTDNDIFRPQITNRLRYTVRLEFTLG